MTANQETAPHNLVIGETCLMAHQLRRAGILTGPNGLFDANVTNLSSTWAAVRDDFDSLLHPDLLEWRYINWYPEEGLGYHKWINLYYSFPNTGIYSWPVFSYFHYDALGDAQRKSLARKAARFMAALDSARSVNLFYYYRNGPGFDLNELSTLMQEFVDYLRDRYIPGWKPKERDFRAFVLYKLDSEHRSSETVKIGDVVVSAITSPDSWVGTDDNWTGESDNDLLDVTFERWRSEML